MGAEGSSTMPGAAPRIATTPTTADLYALGGGGDALLTATEVARRLRIYFDSVYRLCKTGQLPHVRILDALRVRSADLAVILSVQARRPKRRTVISNPTQVRVAMGAIARETYVNRCLKRMQVWMDLR
jgi:hypothetical protein